jgi:hypothetical protein
MKEPHAKPQSRKDFEIEETSQANRSALCVSAPLREI